MSTITDVRCVLSQKAFDAFCEKFYIPEEAHHVLPNRGKTMHERHAGKIGLYTRFFDFANFRLPLSTFLVDILGYFRINISQLSVIGAAKVSCFEILCRVYGVTPTVGLFRCFYVNSKKNGWMSFIKRFGRSPNVTRDPAPVAAYFHVQDYAALVSHPLSFRKFPEEFLCLVGLSRHYTLDEETYPLFLDKDGENMDIFAFIHTSDPTKVKIVKRERKEDEPQLMETTIGRIVPLLPVAPDRDESELDASVDKLFDEGGSGAQTEQGDSAGGGGEQGMNIQPVTETTDAVAEDVIPLQPRRLKKRKTIVADVGGPSHPPRKLREDHETSGRVFIGGKSMSAVQRLFAGAVQNDEVRGEPIPTMPFVTSSVSATPEREGEGHTESITGLNLQTISPPQRFVISSDSSHHSGANIAEAEVDSFARPSVPVITATTTITSIAYHAVVVKEKIIEPFLFAAESTSAGGTDPAMAGLTDLTDSDFLVGGIRTVINPDSNLQKTYVPQWNVTNGSRFDDGGVCRKMVDEFAPSNAEVRMRAEYNIREKMRLKSVVDEKDQLLKARDEEVENLKARLLLKEAEAAKAIRLRAETSKLETTEKSLWDEVNALNERNTILEKEHNSLDVKVTDLEAVNVHELQVSSSDLKGKLSNYENLTERLEEFQDAQLKVINDKFDKLYTDFVEMSLHLEERFYPHLLTTIAGCRWLLTYGMELADGLAAGITHGKEGRVLTDVASYNPSAKGDYVFALQQLQGVNFPLLAELKANKDANIEAVMNILRMEEHLAKILSLNFSFASSTLGKGLAFSSATFSVVVR
nr:hypothetical protein [Tanacetum cinerariifolium]